MYLDSRRKPAQNSHLHENTSRDSNHLGGESPNRRTTMQPCCLTQYVTAHPTLKVSPIIAHLNLQGVDTFTTVSLFFYEWKHAPLLFPTQHWGHSGLENCQYNDSKDKGIDGSFPACELDILFNSCPIIGRPLLELISICMQINAAAEEAGRVGGGGKWPLPHKRDTGNDKCGRQGAFITADFINHTVKYRRAVERWGLLDVCVWACIDLPRAKCVHVEDTHVVMEMFHCFFCIPFGRNPFCVYFKKFELMKILS